MAIVAAADPPRTQFRSIMIPVILAGGSGTRFWPLSRRARPKQLIALWGERPMIAETFDRVASLDAQGRALLVLGRHHVEPTSEALRSLGTEGLELVVEPRARNTAPAIALAAARAEAIAGDDPIAIFPSDHFIGGQQAFEACLQLADERARQGAIVTLGVPPTRPETGYGYIESEGSIDAAPGQGPVALAVRRFVEKPDLATAREYVTSGRFVWNSGMFVLRPSTLWAELERQQPELLRAFEPVRRSGASDAAIIAEAFEKAASISIDYAVMEGAAHVEVIPALFRWSDVGHWAALDEVSATDSRGNVVRAEAVLDEVNDSVVLSAGSERLIAMSGVEGLVVVDTPDALLVLPRERAQRVRELVDALKRKGREDLL